MNTMSVNAYISKPAHLHHVKRDQIMNDDNHPFIENTTKPRLERFHISRIHRIRFSSLSSSFILKCNNINPKRDSLCDRCVGVLLQPNEFFVMSMVVGWWSHSKRVMCKWHPKDYIRKTLARRNKIGSKRPAECGRTEMNTRHISPCYSYILLCCLFSFNVNQSSVILIGNKTICGYYSVLGEKWKGAFSDACLVWYGKLIDLLLIDWF